MRVLHLVLLVAAAASASASAQAPGPPLGGPVPVPQQPYLRYETVDSLGRSIVFFLSEGDATPLPLAVYVQGSGFSSHFVENGAGFRSATGHASLADVARGHARVLLVEKPGTRFGVSGAGDPPDAFRREHTLPRWGEAVAAAVRAARTLPGIDPSRMLVIGHSEGGIVAARLARTVPGVTHVALLAGEGPTQLFSLLRLARAGALLAATGATPDARERALLAAWDTIRAHPDDPDRLWFGHAYPRWASFLATSPEEALEGFQGKVLIVQGLADRAVDPASAEALYATLMSHGQSVTLRRVAGADHSFRLASGQDLWAAILEEVVEWAMKH